MIELVTLDEKVNGNRFEALPGDCFFNVAIDMKTNRVMPPSNKAFFVNGPFTVFIRQAPSITSLAKCIASQAWKLVDFTDGRFTPKRIIRWSRRTVTADEILAYAILGLDYRAEILGDRLLMIDNLVRQCKKYYSDPMSFNVNYKETEFYTVLNALDVQAGKFAPGNRDNINILEHGKNVVESVIRTCRPEKLATVRTFMPTYRGTPWANFFSKCSKDTASTMTFKTEWPIAEVVAEFNFYADVVGLKRIIVLRPCGRKEKVQSVYVFNNARFSVDDSGVITRAFPPFDVEKLNSLEGNGNGERWSERADFSLIGPKTGTTLDEFTIRNICAI